MNYEITYPAGVEDEYDYWEIEQKGWMDITISVGGTDLPVSVYDPDRLSLDMGNELGRLR